MFLKKTALISFIFLISFFVLSSCVSRYEDLQLALTKHYSTLQWGEPESASINVDPKIKEEFISEWEKRFKDNKIAGYELKRISIAEDGIRAIVKIEFMLYSEKTMVAKHETEVHLWEMKNNIWYRVK
ncbi:MAG: hypothetical protein ABIA04_13400 [Pseudomonadota bacterium]